MCVWLCVCVSFTYSCRVEIFFGSYKWARVRDHNHDHHQIVSPHSPAFDRKMLFSPHFLLPRHFKLRTHSTLSLSFHVTRRQLKIEDFVWTPLENVCYKSELSDQNLVSPVKNWNMRDCLYSPKNHDKWQLWNWITFEFCVDFCWGFFSGSCLCFLPGDQTSSDVQQRLSSSCITKDSYTRAGLQTMRMKWYVPISQLKDLYLYTYK